MKRALVWMAALLLGACSPAVTAPAPSTSVDPPASKAAGQVELDLGPLADEPVCSKSTGADELCIGGLRTAMEQGLERVLAAQFDGSGPPYFAKFRFRQMSHELDDGKVTLKLAWTFTLVSKDAGPVLMLDEQTTGPETFPAGGDAAPAVGAALGAVLDAIAEPMTSSLP